MLEQLNNILLLCLSKLTYVLTHHQHFPVSLIKCCSNVWPMMMMMSSSVVTIVMMVTLHFIITNDAAVLTLRVGCPYLYIIEPKGTGDGV